MTAVEGRVAVVTGGASGIGAGIGRALAASGARVVVADIDAAAAEAEAHRDGGIGLACDVSDAGAVAALAAAVAERAGPAAVVVANAGVGPSAPIARMTAEDWRWLLGVNLFGVVNTVTAFLPQLLAAPGGGHLVVTASMAALAPTPQLGAYAASKAAVVALAESLAAEHADDGLGVTIVFPGPTRTRIGDSQRARSDRGALADVDLEKMGFDWIRWREPEDVGRDVVRAILDDRRYLATHPELWSRFADRVERIRAGF